MGSNWIRDVEGCRFRAGRGRQNDDGRSTESEDARVQLKESPSMTRSGIVHGSSPMVHKQTPLVGLETRFVNPNLPI